MYCRNCGKEISDQAYVCPNCGVLVQSTTNSQKQRVEESDNESKVGWGILSFFFPLVGLILFCVWHSERPKTAKVCGLCALAAVISSVILGILGIVFAITLFYGILESLPAYDVFLALGLLL